MAPAPGRKRLYKTNYKSSRYKRTYKDDGTVETSRFVKGMDREGHKEMGVRIGKEIGTLQAMVADKLAVPNNRVLIKVKGIRIRTPATVAYQRAVGQWLAATFPNNRFKKGDPKLRSQAWKENRYVRTKMHTARRLHAWKGKPATENFLYKANMPGGIKAPWKRGAFKGFRKPPGSSGIKRPKDIFAWKRGFGGGSNATPMTMISAPVKSGPPSRPAPIPPPKPRLLSIPNDNPFADGGEYKRTNPFKPSSEPDFIGGAFEPLGKRRMTEKAMKQDMLGFNSGGGGSTVRQSPSMKPVEENKVSDIYGDVYIDKEDLERQQQLWEEFEYELKKNKKAYREYAKDAYQMTRAKIEDWKKFKGHALQKAIYDKVAGYNADGLEFQFSPWYIPKHLNNPNIFIKWSVENIPGALPSDNYDYTKFY